MNILLINYEYPPLGAGAATQNAYLAAEFAANGHQVVQLTAAFGKQASFDLENGVMLYRIKSRRKRLNQSNMLEMLSFVWHALFKIKYIVRHHQIEKAIVFFSIPCGPLGIWIKLLHKIPYVVSLRGGDVPGYDVKLNGFHGLLAPVRRKVLKHAIAVVANSQGLAQLSNAADPFKTVVINNGTDTDFFFPNIAVRDKQLINFLFVGRLHAIKNINLLLEWAKEMSDTEKNFRLTIYGQGPEEMRIRMFINKNKLSNKVFLYHWLPKDKLRIAYQQADVFVNPSLNEGMPNTVMEAMACALPVIASNVAGNRDLIAHEKNGYLFENKSLPPFLAVSRLLMADALLRTQIGRAARETIVHNYSVKAMAKAYLIQLANEN